MFHAKKCQTGRKMSPAWDTFDVIYEHDTKQQVANFFYCTECTSIVYNPYGQGNTNKLLRHTCYCDEAGDTRQKPKLLIRKVDKERLKIASAHFVSKDLRPFYAVECEGIS